MADVGALYGSNVCSEEEKKKCQAEFGKYLEWSCENCEKKKAGEIHPYTKYLLFIRRMIKGGRPYRAEEFSDEQWYHLGLINELIEDYLNRRNRIF